MTQANELLSEQAYVALFGRPADVGGLKAQTNLLDNGASLATLVNNMTHSAEFDTLFAGKNTEGVLHQILDNSNKFQSYPTSYDLSEWVGKVDSGQTTIGDIIANFKLTYSGGFDALAYKVYAAYSFTHHVEDLHLENAYSGAAAANVAHAYISVIGSPSTYGWANAALDQYVHLACAAHG